VDAVSGADKIVDIGPRTVTQFKDVLHEAGTVVWNGPMGVFEIPEFARGTQEIARALANSDGEVIVGGGDSIAAVEQAGVADRMAHISTGGGASLEFLEGRELPGVAVLADAEG
jgi:phosphoglycerate kinase